MTILNLNFNPNKGPASSAVFPKDLCPICSGFFMYEKRSLSLLLYPSSQHIPRENNKVKSAIKENHDWKKSIKIKTANQPATGNGTTTTQPGQNCITSAKVNSMVFRIKEESSLMSMIILEGRGSE